jgi:hypothetical protein
MMLSCGQMMYFALQNIVVSPTATDFVGAIIDRPRVDGDIDPYNAQSVAPS